MRGILVAAISTLTLAPSFTQAGVSDDLVFCSKLTNGRERIACYDAAARIAERSMQQRTAPTTAATAPALKPALVTAPTAYVERSASVITQPPQTFHGLYATAGGSYGVGAPIFFSNSDNVQSISGTMSPHGASAVGSIGYNIQASHAVLGFELSGRFGEEAFNRSKTASISQPLGVIGTSTLTFETNVDASVHASLRAGMAFADTMAFMKAGIGVAHMRQTVRSELSGTLCTSVNFVGNSLVCTNRESLPGGTLVADDYVVPSLLLGLGIEHNFGPVFGRLEAEAEAITRLTQPNPNLYWSARVLGSVGIRF